MNPRSSFDLSARTAIVTGGAKGLGYNISRALCRAGAKVLIVGRDHAALEEAAFELRSDFEASVEVASLDLADRVAVGRFALDAERILGRVDIFVGNAAMEHHTSVAAVDPVIMDRLIETNLVANIALTSAFAPGMKANGWGRFIYVSSNAASVASHWGHGVYSATKGAIEAYCRCAAVELGPFGITANSIAPGTYATTMVKDRWAQMGDQAAKESHDVLANMNAMGRWGEPKEIEGAVVLLASDAGSFISGTVLPVDGGLTIKMVPS